MHKKILIIGEVFVDFHLDLVQDGKRSLRLGGVFHAMRACHALDVEYAVAFCAPTYLKQDIYKFGKEDLNASKVYHLGTIDKSPNVMLIENSDETVNQRYESILSEQAEYVEQMPLQDIIDNFMPSDVVLFPGRFISIEIMSALSSFMGKVHIDMNYDSETIRELKGVSVDTVFISTSSTSFKEFFEWNSYEQLIQNFKMKDVHQLVIKENRGGSWAYDFENNTSNEAPAFFGPIEHSVGVGDVYDIAYLCGLDTDNVCAKMRFASWSAFIYAQTFLQKAFVENMSMISQNSEEFIEMDGIRAPWNQRLRYPIYMAAPDFSNVNTEKLDDLEAALRYHNFVPRFPVKENGQVNEETDIDTERKIFAKDIELLDECKLMIATLLYNDQGTLVEIGYYLAREKPIVLYDPYKVSDNMFLENACTFYCNSISAVIEKVFEIISRMEKNESGL